MKNYYQLLRKIKSYSQIDKLYENSDMTEQEMHQLKADYSRLQLEKLLDKMVKIAGINN